MRYFLDLFSGIGGFHLGAQWAGLKFDGYYFSEVDDYAIKVYRARFPNAVPLGDIRAITGADLPQGEWIIAGGFPCQDISVAGKGAGLAGERSGLWYEYARLIGELRPRYAIMKNVGALTFRGLNAVLGSLAEIGYDAEWQDIRASDVGAPHRRERIWIVAYPNAMHCAGSSEPWEQFKRPAQSTGGSADRMEAGDDVAYPYSEHGQRRPESQQSAGACWQSRNQSARGSAAGNVADTESEDGRKQNGHGKMSTRGSSSRWWTTEPDVGRVAHGVPSRVDRLKCLGNSIVPQIAEMIFQQIRGLG